MAVQETNHHDATPRIACALPLVDFDWKLKYAVASATIAAVNKPLLRLELYVSKVASKVEDVGLETTVYPENQIQPVVAEFSKAQLDALLGTMDAIEQAHMKSMEGKGTIEREFNENLLQVGKELS